jgi:Bifunctional DNA primase/polymerase, N-terminal/AAA domain/Primase C terminal 1 (PriCT-1)
MPPVTLKNAAGEIVASEPLPADPSTLNIEPAKERLLARWGALRDGALAYAARGWPVFPVHTIRDGRCSCGDPACGSPGKHPIGRLVPHGFKDATTDEATIRAWWMAEAAANVGIATGATSRVFVLDVDPRHGGDERLTELERQYGPLPRTTEAATGGGGRHLFFTYPGTRISSQPIAPGLDVKGDGGYVVAPPSVTTGRYRWVVPRDEVEPVEAPGWLLDFVSEPPPSAAAPAECEVEVLREGCRNDALYRLARRLHARGRSEEQIHAALVTENLMRCRPPLPAAELAALAAKAFRQADRPDFTRRSPTGTSEGAADGPVLKTLAEVEPEEVDWLWPGRVARGKLTVLVGDPGLGKSYLSLDIAARITRGSHWPDGSRAPRGKVILLSAEDGLADTIRPRLDALGANAAAVTALQAVRVRGKDRPFVLCTDLEQLRRAIDQTGADLVVVDPLSAYLGRADSYKDTEVRAVLGPLAGLAEQADVAVLAVLHLTKDDQRRALYRVQGSVAFVAAARIVLAVTKDGQDDHRRLLLPLKANLTAAAAGLAFTLKDGHLEWEREPVRGVDADVALAPPSVPRPATVRAQGTDLLRELLADGPMHQREIKNEAAARGISERALWRAKADLGVATRRVGAFADRDGWEWSLAETANPASRAK